MKVPVSGNGGMILLSTDVNAMVENQIGDRIMARLRTSWQRLEQGPFG